MQSSQHHSAHLRAGLHQAKTNEILMSSVNDSKTRLSDSELLTCFKIIQNALHDTVTEGIQMFLHSLKREGYQISKHENLRNTANLDLFQWIFWP